MARPGGPVAGRSSIAGDEADATCSNVVATRATTSPRCDDHFGFLGLATFASRAVVSTALGFLACLGLRISRPPLFFPDIALQHRRDVPGAPNRGPG